MKQKGTFKRILGLLKPYSFRVIISIIFSAVNVACSLYVPVLIGRAIDLALSQNNVDIKAIVAILTQTGVTVAAAALTLWVSNVINNTVTYHVVRDVRNDAFEKLTRLPLSYLDRRRTGELVSRIITDSDTFADGLLMGFTRLFTGVATVIGTLVFMLTLSPAVTLAVVLITPVSLFAARFIATRTYKMFRLQSDTRAEQTAFIEENIGAFETVKAYSAEKKNNERFDEINDRLAKFSLRAIFFSSLTNPVTRFVNSLVYAAVALCGGLACISAYEAAAVTGAAVTFTVGTLTACLAYANQYTKPFNEISGVITELQNAFACASRIFELIDEEAETKEKEDELADVKGNVEISSVSFSYVPEKPLIEDLNLSVKEGQRVAIVGPTGCGKTTFINLLMRFYDVKKGSISIENKDIRDVTRHSLRGNIGMVLQETWLKNGTVKENIAMGKPDATDEEIIAAAVASHADPFIRRLPQGYDTVLSEDGGSLSQGQKQLLCISRVMLTLPPMLILDEATSSIDTRTEIKIQEAFKKMMKGRTSFIVAHRLSTIKEADVILVMKDGNIIEQGTHDELLKKQGFYCTLYNSQF